MIVVDASVLATSLGDDGPDGDHARARLRGERLSAPELVDLEVTSVLRRQVRSGAVDLRRAALAMADLAAMPLQRAPHRPLLARCWELRDNLTVYDASYAALAEALDVTLLTGDGRLAHAPGLRCHVEILRTASLSGGFRKLPFMHELRTQPRPKREPEPEDLHAARESIGMAVADRVGRSSERNAKQGCRVRRLPCLFGHACELGDDPVERIAVPSEQGPSVPYLALNHFPRHSQVTPRSHASLPDAQHHADDALA